MRNYPAMTIFDAARELCLMEGCSPDGYFGEISNHLRAYSRLRRKLSGGVKLTKTERAAFDAVEDTKPAN